MIKRVLIGLLVVLVLAACASTAPDVPALQPTADTSDAVARISYPSGTIELVTRAEFEQARDKLLQGAPEEYVLDFVTSRHLLLEQGRTQGIVADPKEVDDFVENIRSQTCTQIPLEDPAAQADPAQLFEACANFFGFQGSAGMRRYLQEEIIINQVIEAQAKGEEVHAAHILVETEEAALAARERVTTGGEDFAAVAQEISIDPSVQQNGGDMGFFGPGAMVPEFEQAAFALADGEISEPVQTQFGWHVIKTIERRPSEQVSPEAANAYREQVLAQAEQDGRVEFLITPAPPPTAAALPTVDIGPIESAIPEDATAAPPTDATTIAPGVTVVPEETVVPEATLPPVAPAETTTATP